VHHPKRFGTRYKIFMQGKEQNKLNQVTTHISKKPTEVSSFYLIVKT
jgi:hypothetical protein